jgi:ComF family protein
VLAYLQTVRPLANAVVRAFLAPECASCGDPLADPLSNPVCEPCWRAVALLTPPWCVLCGDALPDWRAPANLCARCRRQRPVLSAARSAGEYSGSLREIVHAFKYEGRRVLAPRLAGMMRSAGRDILDGADALVPVPLHPWRAMARGFNQADDLATHLGLPIWRVLRRRRHGPPQASLPAARRHSNVRGAYALRSGVPAASIRGRLRARLRGRTVVLVDDVMTTGATLNACAEVLVSAGAQAVRALTVARAAAGRPVPPRL